MCVNVSKSAWMVFVLIPHCNPLSIWMCGSFSLKDYEAVIMTYSKIGTKL